MELNIEQVEALMVEAGFAGDSAMVELCELAIDGDEEAGAKVQAVISANRAEVEYQTLQGA